MVGVFIHMEILGIPIDDVTHEQAVHRLGLFLDGQTPRFVTTPNPEMIVQAQKDRRFMEVLRRSDLSIPDGQGLLFASWFLGEPLRERVTGTDIVDDLAGLCAARGMSMFLLGGAEGVAEDAARNLIACHEGLRIVGAESGGVVERDSDSVWRSSRSAMRRLREADPHVLLVAFGQGKQEEWIVQHMDSFENLRIAVGVGGAFDFISGNVRRAPVRMRRIGLEWLWRLITEPRRAGRILRAVAVFPFLVLRNGR